jgi:hypothetical protein
VRAAALLVVQRVAPVVPLCLFAPIARVARVAAQWVRAVVLLAAAPPAQEPRVAVGQVEARQVEERVRRAAHAALYFLYCFVDLAARVARAPPRSAQAVRPVVVQLRRARRAAVWAAVRVRARPAVHAVGHVDPLCRVAREPAPRVPGAPIVAAQSPYLVREVRVQFFARRLFRVRCRHCR